jgi:hypothetical protein
MSMANRKPQQAPPAEEAVAAGAAATAPTEAPPQEARVTSDGAAVAPTETPPQEATEEREGIGATWLNSKKVTALWSINNTRNSWVYLTDAGWKKLADNSDSAVMALTMLSSHAQHTGVTVNALEDVGKITQIYVW